MTHFCSDLFSGVKLGSMKYEDFLEFFFLFIFFKSSSFLCVAKKYERFFSTFAKWLCFSTHPEWGFTLSSL